MQRRVGQGGLPAVVLSGLIVLGACQELGVTNTIDPDRERAIGNPSDVEALIGGAFYPTFWQALNGSGGGLNGLITSLFPNAAAEMTATLSEGLSSFWYLDLVEPRRPHNNAASISATVGPHGPRILWSLIGSASSIPYDGLVAINHGLRITEDGQDVTPRAEAFAKFMQGWSWGYGALTWDQVNILPESELLPEDPAAIQEVMIRTLTPYDEAIERAVESLAAAIAVARANPSVVHFPAAAESALWFGSPTPISNARFIEMANTLAARLLVLNARTPEERAQVDWTRVLQHTAKGLTDDFEFQLSSTRSSQLLQRTQNNTTTGTTNARLDYRLTGPADTTGSYQAWIGSPPGERRRFDIGTSDRRIAGTTPTSDGAYTRYRADNNGFTADRGLYLFSAYQWARHWRRTPDLTSAQTGFDSGRMRMMTVDENNLLRAEALLHTGDLTAAAELINVTRTRQHTVDGVTYDGLPEVTANGVPESGDCVPRTDEGTCGDLLTALRYERMLELAGLDAIRGYADSRGFGMLPDGALIHWPVPGNVLELYGLQNYTYGGVGGRGSATYAPMTMP